jgi:hypothetical protein
VSVGEVAAELGITDRTARRWMETLDLPEEKKEAVRRGEKTVKKAKREAEQAQRRSKPRPPAPPLPTGEFDYCWQIHPGATRAAPRRPTAASRTSPDRSDASTLSPGRNLGSRSPSNPAWLR